MLLYLISNLPFFESFVLIHQLKSPWAYISFINLTAVYLFNGKDDG